jgi:hypothetical protein
MINTIAPIAVADYDALVDQAMINEDQDPDKLFYGDGCEGGACGMTFFNSDNEVYFLYAPVSGNSPFDALNFPLPTRKNKENRFLVYIDDQKLDGCLIGEVSAVKNTAKTFANFNDALAYFNQCSSEQSA